MNSMGMKILAFLQELQGGRRRNPRKGNMYKTITSLINLASLASTKAKKEKNNLVLGYSGIDEIAI